MGALEQYWSGISQWLQIQADMFNRLIDHNGEMGRANELTVAEFLVKLLPPNLGVGSGVIIAPNGKQSRQCDLVVHEIHKHPQLFAQTSQFVYPADTVAMTVEVKTTLDAAEVEAIGKNTRSVRNARKAGSDREPFITVVAFATSASSHTTLKWFNTLDEDSRPDLICIVTPGVLISPSRGAMKAECVLLHRADADGARESREWIVGAAHESSTLIDGSKYPISTVKSDTAQTKYVFDPGRALLLFSVRILAGLGERGSVGTAWWQYYLDTLTSETVEILPD